jgi:hypothetical protein
VSLAPVTLLGLTALYVLVSQVRHSYPAQFTWPSYFARMRNVSWLVLLLLGLDVAIAIVRRDRGSTARDGADALGDEDAGEDEPAGEATASTASPEPVG